MYYKAFKDMHISALGFGGLRLPMVKGKPNLIDRAKGQEVVDAAMACGINYFDTAFTYQTGDSERFLGEALSKYSRELFSCHKVLCHSKFRHRRRIYRATAQMRINSSRISTMQKKQAVDAQGFSTQILGKVDFTFFSSLG